MSNDEELSLEDVKHIALLARIGITEEEANDMRDDLVDILKQFKILNRVETNGVQPTGHSVDVTSIMRDDVVKPSYPREDILSNVPDIEDHRIRVRAIFE